MPTADQPGNIGGKTCLVTGGAGGLGIAIVAAFLEAGANVVVCDNNEGRIDKMKSELGGKGPLYAVTMDITDRGQVHDLFAKIAAEYGTLDILINNAAIMDRFDPVGDVELDLWDKVMEVNLTAPMLMSKLAVRSMMSKAEPGTCSCIINMASGAAKAGWLAGEPRIACIHIHINHMSPTDANMVKGTAYTASKHGLIGLTKSTAAFYGPLGIRCNALMVGVIGGTHLNEAFREGCNALGRQRLAEIFSGAKPQPCSVGDVAGICLSMVSGSGWSAVNGAVIAVDHGWTSVVG
jgi:NAD(P)-dependent dehydrogenase (short-subunit alcohol dehydrogenase family)